MPSQVSWLLCASLSQAKTLAYSGFLILRHAHTNIKESETLTVSGFANGKLTNPSLCAFACLHRFTAIKTLL